MKKIFVCITLLFAIILFSACGVIEYEINFITNGGNEVSNLIVNSNQELTLPNIAKFGYTFGGWFTDNNSFINEINNGHKATTNMTLYAKWTPVEYTLSFNSNNGS